MPFNGQIYTERERIRSARADTKNDPILTDSRKSCTAFQQVRSYPRIL